MAQIVSFHCVLKNCLGKVISETTNLDVLTSPLEEGGEAILRGLANRLENLKRGETCRIALAAAEAYGFYDPNKVILYPRRLLPKSMEFVKNEPVTIVSKTGIRRAYRVLEVHKDMIQLDGNHPLAGQDLVFEIEILSTRMATADEMGESPDSITKTRIH